MHLLEFLIDATPDEMLQTRALELKSVSLGRLAQTETSFISHSILVRGAEQAAETARNKPARDTSDPK